MTRIFAVFLFLSLAQSALAGPTGLIVIPTADVREIKTYEIELQHDGRKGFPVDVETTFLNTQFGLVDRFEAGVDLGLTDESRGDVLFNYKYGFPVGSVPVAVGTYNIGASYKPISYLVSGTRLGRFQIHLGAQRSNDDFQLLLGAHRQAGRFLISADYTSGSENFASAGFEYAFSEILSVQWGVLLPNDDAEENQYTLHLIYNGIFW